MPSQHRTFLKSSILMLIVLMLCNVNLAETDENHLENAKLYRISKRNFLSREREYLKANPLSRELRSFIRRYKRRAKHDIKKREELDKDNMFVVRDGEIRPLNEIDPNATDNNEENKLTNEDEGKFTVLPLIVKVTVSKERALTCAEEITELTTEECITKASVRRLGQLREISTTIVFETLVEEITPMTTPTTITTTTTTTPTVNASNDEPTTPGPSVNPKLLSKVYEDIKELMSDQTVTKGIESAVCNVNGDWDSTAGGMQFRISVQNDTKHPDVYIVERDPPEDEGLFKEGNWSITGYIPFPKSSSILVLNAHTYRGKKLIALFVGECRICEQEETISGHWMIQRQSKDCSDREVSHKFVSEILKKNNVRQLEQQRLISIPPSV